MTHVSRSLRSIIACKLYNDLTYAKAKIRAAFWRYFARSIGKDVYIQARTRLLCPGGISLGDGTRVNHDCDLGGHGGLTIGKNVMIAPGVTIMSSSHGIADKHMLMQDQPDVAGPVVIEDNVWLGTGVVVTYGVTIGTGAVIGANAVVTSDVKAYEVVGGVPAKHIRTRE